MTRKLTVGVDIDDVLFSWYDKAHAASVMAGITNGVTPSTWSPYEEYGVDAEVWYDVLSAITLDGTLYSGQPKAGALEALEQIRSHGHTVHLITARGFNNHAQLIREQTIAWVHDYVIPHDTLTFAASKTELLTDVFIDDAPKHVQALAERGVEAWLMDAPHNGAFRWAARAYSMADFAAHVIVKGHSTS